MAIVLLDTDVVSFMLKGDSRAASYAPLLTGNRLTLSFMTVAELFQSAAVRKWGPKRVAQLESHLSAYLIVPVNLAACRIWGTLRAERQAMGRTIAPQDAWIAATAMRHVLPLVSHNASDFQGIAGLTLLTPGHP
jgi:tRNA(fMet)-specific endonuclease VapC